MTAQSVAIVFQAGQTPKMAVDGEKNTLSATPGSPTGALNISDTLEWGKGGRGSIGHWLGKAALLLIKEGGMSDAEMESITAALVDPSKVYGVGASNQVTVANRSPIAQPLFVEATAGVAQNFNVGAAAYDPNGDALIATDVSVVSGAATATVPSATGGNVRLTGNSGLEQEVVLDFGVRDAGNKRSRGRLYARVAEVSSPPPVFPKYPPAATGTLRVPSQYATIAAALTAAQPGNHIIVANGTYREAITSAKSGTAAGGYIVIRAENHLGATLAGGTDGSVRGWKFTGSYIWVTGFVCNNPQEHSPNFYQGGKNSYYNSDRPEYQFRLSGSNLRVTNCRINSPCGIGINNSCNGIDICYNTFTMSLAPRWSQANAIYMGHSPPNSAGASNILIARNKWTGDAAVTHWTSNASDPSVQGNDNDGRYCFYSGNNEPEDNNTGNNRSVRFVENFVEMVNTPTGWYCKRGYEIRRNYMRSKVVAFNQRHGGYSRADGTVFADLTDAKRVLIVGNNFDKGIFRLNDTDHLVVSNRFGGNVEMYYGGRRTQGTSVTNYNINPAPGWIQAASRVIFVGNTFAAQFRAGEDESAGGNKFKVWDTAQQTQWGNDEPAQGGTIKGVRNYAAGIAQPALVRVTNLYGEKTIEDGNAGYQELAGDGGYTSLVQAFVTRAELESATGADASGGGGGGGGSDDLPAALRTINVTSNAQLTAALSGNFSGLTTTPAGASGPLAPGDHIACTGAFTGTFTLTTAGTAANPIVVKAATLGNATFSGRIDLNAARTAIQRLSFTGGSEKVRIQKADTRVTRCLFTGGTADGKISFTTTTCQRTRIDRNRFADFTGAAIRGNIDSSNEITGTKIDLNHFNGHTCTPANESVILFLTDMFNDSDLTMEFNLFENVLIGAGTIIGQKEMVSVKTADVTLRGNTVIGSTTGIFFSLRETNRCLVEGNWFEAGAFIRAGGDDHVIRNNRSTGKVLELSSGDAYATTADPPVCAAAPKAGKTVQVLEGGTTVNDCVTAHTAARQATVSNNVGGIAIGDSSYVGTNFKVRDITLSNNSEAHTAIANTFVAGTIAETGVGSHTNTAVKLTATAVGPSAP